MIEASWASRYSLKQVLDPQEMLPHILAYAFCVSAAEKVGANIKTTERSQLGEQFQRPAVAKANLRAPAAAAASRA